MHLINNNNNKNFRNKNMKKRHTKIFEKVVPIQITCSVQLRKQKYRRRIEKNK